MNGLLTRLNIIRNNILVNKGQLIYNSSNDGGSNLPEGLYLVKSIQLKHEGCNEDRKKKYIHTLDLVDVGCDKDKLIVGSNQYTVSLDAKAIEESFGIGYKAKKGIIYEYIKDLFDKTGKEGFDPKINYDAVLSGVAKTVAFKFPLKISNDEFEDMVMDVLLHAINADVIKKYDPKRSLEKYLATYMFNAVRSYMVTWMKRHMRNVEDERKRDEDETFEHELEHRKLPGGEQLSPEKKVNYRELISGLEKFMKKRTRGDKQVEVFKEMLAGSSPSEIAEKHNIGRNLVSRYIGDIKDSIKEYAKKTNNTDLLYLLEHSSKIRTHSNEDKDFFLIVNVMKDYNKKFGTSLSERRPAGEISKVKRVYLNDKVTDDAITKAVLSDTYSSKALKKELGEYFELLSNQDDLIESDEGRLVGLRIVSDEVRDVAEQAKCKKKKAIAEESGFFVYSKCGMGPHKVLKEDGTFSIKLNKTNPVKVFKSKRQAEIAASKNLHKKLNLKVGIYPDEFLKEIQIDG